MLAAADAFLVLMMLLLLLGRVGTVARRCGWLGAMLAACRVGLRGLRGQEGLGLHLLAAAQLGEEFLGPGVFGFELLV